MTQLKTPKQISLPLLETVKDPALRAVFEELLKSNDLIFKNIYDDFTALSGAYKQSEVVYFTRDTSLASGDQDVATTFDPKVVILFAAQHTTTQMTIGLGVNGSGTSISTRDAIAADQWAHATGTVIILNNIQGSSVTYQATTLTMGTLKFTLGWVKSGAASGTLRIGALVLG